MENFKNNQYVFVYLYGIFIFSQSKEQHVHVQSVLQRLLENSLFVKAEKCESLQCPFWGTLLVKGNIQMDPAKVSGVTSWLSLTIANSVKTPSLCLLVPTPVGNYDIGNRELRAVKMALEWCHWLEGSKEPFLMWTDH